MSFTPEQIINFLLGCLATGALAIFSLIVRYLALRNADLTKLQKLMSGFVSREELTKESAERMRLELSIATGLEHEIKWTRGGNFAIVPTDVKFHIGVDVL